MKKLLVIIVLLLLPSNAFSVTLDPDTFDAGIKALNSDTNRAAYSKFIDVFQIIYPHPDKEIQAFIDQAKSGDADSFAFIAYYIWSGEAGFKENKVAAKFALMRAVNDGSAQAAFWIAQSFFSPEAAAERIEDQKIDNFFSGIQWLGVSAGMGESRAHERAMKLIDDAAKGNIDLKRSLTALYNKGLEESKTYKKNHTLEKPMKSDKTKP